MRLMPTIEGDDPDHRAICDSSTTPLLDMQFEIGGDVHRALARLSRSGSPPTRRRRVAQRLAAGFGQRQHLAVELAGHAAAADNRTARIRWVLPPGKSTISMVCSSSVPASRSARTISSPVTTPAMPSKRPPDGTVIAVRADGDDPERRIFCLRSGRSGCRRYRSAWQARPRRIFAPARYGLRENRAVNERRV